MSNPVSLYVEDQSVLIAELSDQAVVEGEREPKLRDYLETANSDLYTFELSELYRAKGSALKYQPADRIINVILWSWINESFKIMDMDAPTADELALDLAISESSLRGLEPAVKGFNPTQVSSALHAPNEVWQSAEELVSYLSCWHQAFLDALKENKGLFYKIWV